jgi:uncharacterized membrane protein YedE/YeeE
MSKIEEESIGFTIAEKFFALLLILIGVLVLYSVSASPDLVFPLLFNLGGMALVVLGVIMVLAKVT